MKKKQFDRKVSLRLNKNTVVNLNPDEMQQVYGATTRPCGGEAATDVIYTVVTPIFWC